MTKDKRLMTILHGLKAREDRGQRPGRKSWIGMHSSLFILPLNTLLSTCYVLVLASALTIKQ